MEDGGKYIDYGSLFDGCFWTSSKYASLSLVQRRAEWNNERPPRLPNIGDIILSACVCIIRIPEGGVGGEMRMRQPPLCRKTLKRGGRYEKARRSRVRRTRRSFDSTAVASACSYSSVSVVRVAFRLIIHS